MSEQDASEVIDKLKAGGVETLRIQGAAVDHENTDSINQLAAAAIAKAIGTNNHQMKILDLSENRISGLSLILDALAPAAGIRISRAILE